MLLQYVTLIHQMGCDMPSCFYAISPCDNAYYAQAALSRITTELWESPTISPADGATIYI